MITKTEAELKIETDDMLENMLAIYGHRVAAIVASVCQVVACDRLNIRALMTFCHMYEPVNVAQMSEVVAKQMDIVQRATIGLARAALRAEGLSDLQCVELMRIVGMVTARQHAVAIAAK